MRVRTRAIRALSRRRQTFLRHQIVVREIRCRTAHHLLTHPLPIPSWYRHSTVAKHDIKNGQEYERQPSVTLVETPLKRPRAERQPRVLQRYDVDCDHVSDRILWKWGSTLWKLYFNQRRKRTKPDLDKSDCEGVHFRASIKAQRLTYSAKQSDRRQKCIASPLLR